MSNPIKQVKPLSSKEKNVINLLNRTADFSTIDESKIEELILLAEKDSLILKRKKMQDIRFTYAPVRDGVSGAVDKVITSAQLEGHDYTEKALYFINFADPTLSYLDRYYRGADENESNRIVNTGFGFYNEDMFELETKYNNVFKIKEQYIDDEPKNAR